jgi:hypothetical protein
MALSARRQSRSAMARATYLVRAFFCSAIVMGLSGEIASVTVFTAGISAGSRMLEADKALIQFLSGSIAAPILKAKGFELQ